jgi:SAM-dependent methyltransferase
LLDALLAEGLDFAEYTASEFSMPRVARLKARFSDRRVRVLSADAEALPGPLSAGYDAVIMVAVLEHLIDPILALKRVRQLLSPEGFVYIDTPNIAKYTRRAKLLFGRFPATASRREGLTTYSGASVSLHDEGHLHYFTYRSLGRVLSEYCGYSRIVPLAYHCGHRPFGRILGTALARLWPQMFSEIALIAYR